MTFAARSEGVKEGGGEGEKQLECLYQPDSWIGKGSRMVGGREERSGRRERGWGGREVRSGRGREGRS